MCCPAKFDKSRFICHNHADKTPLAIVVKHSAPQSRVIIGQSAQALPRVDFSSKWT
jgi:hypothetical protein